MKSLNQQTPGPIRVETRDRYIHLFAKTPRGGYSIADANINDWDTANPIISFERANANAALLAASYSAFDKAGRELGIDAAVLARSIDLVALITTLQDYTNPFKDRQNVHERFLDILAKLPKPENLHPCSP